MNIMNYWDAPIVQMTLSERGLWLRFEAMKLEILELRNTIYARNKEISDLTEKKEIDGTLVYVPTELSQLEEWDGR